MLMHPGFPEQGENMTCNPEPFQVAEKETTTPEPPPEAEVEVKAPESLSKSVLKPVSKFMPGSTGDPVFTSMPELKTKTRSELKSQRVLQFLF